MTTLIQITDCHLFADLEKTGYDQINPYQTLKSVLSAVKDRSPELVLVTGDISGDGSLLSYQHFVSLWNECGLNCAYKVIPGNHDNLEHMQTVFAQDCFYPAKTLAFGDWLIVGMDSKQKGTMGWVSQAQMSAASAAMARHSGKPVLCAVHHHPIACEGWMDKHEWLNRQDFLQWVETQPQIKLVVYGHIHHEKLDLRSGTSYYASPSTCWQWAVQREFATAKTLPGYRLLRLGKDGQFETQVIRIRQ